MEVRYNPTVLAPSVINEIMYFRALTSLRKLRDNGIITAENYKISSVGIAERFGVSPYKV